MLGLHLTNRFLHIEHAPATSNANRRDAIKTMNKRISDLASAEADHEVGTKGVAM